MELSAVSTAGFKNIAEMIYFFTVNNSKRRIAFGAPDCVVTTTTKVE
jgi:hypothetical protein